MQRPIPLRTAAAPVPGRPSLRAFLELGFRPLYLAGAVWSMVSVAIWVFAPQWPSGPLAGVAWHAHEMLWAFVATIAVGFLLTASANWTGQVPLAGTPLGVLLLLWLVARVGFLTGGVGAWWIAAVAEFVFFVAAAAATARVIWRTRNRRNYVVPLMLLGLALTDALFLASLDDWTALRLGFEGGMLVMALIALLVARRVVPFFAMRAVPGLKIPMHERSSQVQLAAGAVALVAVLLEWRWPLALALTLAGALAAWQLVDWRPAAVWRRPILWILYVGYAGLAAGLLVAAARAAGVGMPAALPAHLIGAAGFSVLIIGMLTRTALGHLGRGLVLDRSMIASYWILIAAVALRLAAFWMPWFAPWLLPASAAAWAAAFAFYLWRFTPWMIRPRPDVSQPRP